MWGGVFFQEKVEGGDDARVVRRAPCWEKEGAGHEWSGAGDVRAPPPPEAGPRADPAFTGSWRGSEVGRSDPGLSRSASTHPPRSLGVYIPEPEFSQPGDPSPSPSTSSAIDLVTLQTTSLRQ